MKKKLSILAAGILAGTLCAQNAVTVKQKQYSGWKARDFACNQQAEIVNDKESGLITCLPRNQLS